MGGYGKRKRGYCWWWWPPQSASLYISLCLWLWWWSLITQNIIWDQKFVLCLLLFRCLCLCLCWCLVCDCDDDDCSHPHSGTMCFPGKIPISMGIRANNIFGLISKIFQFMSKFIFFCKMNLVKTYSVQNTLQAKYYIEDVQVVILFHLPNVLFNLQMHDSVMTHKSAYSVFHQHFCVKNQIVHF